MAVSVNMEINDGLVEIPVATTEFFKMYWEPAIEECGLKVFHEYTSFGKNQLFEVLSELDRLSQWTEINLVGKEYVYMHGRIEMLKEEIPKMFEMDESVTLYID